MKTIEIPTEYRRLFDNDWREAAIFGGRFSLKSHTVARFLLIRARQTKTRVGCFREFQNSIGDSSYQLLLELIKLYELKEFVATNNSIVNTLNGSDFLFRGLWNNEQSIKSIEGIDIAWVEEAQTVSEESLEILTPTVRKENSKIIYTYNRLLEDDPVHTRLVLQGRPNTLIINANYDIAIKYKMMPQVIYDEIMDDKKNRPALYKHKWLGEPNTVGDAKLTEGQLKQNCTGQITLAETNEPVVMGVDTGLKLDFVIGNKRLGLFYHADAENYSTLDDLMRRWPKMIAVVDAGGDLIGSREFFERWRGRVFLCYFTGEKKTNEIAWWGEGDKFGQASVDRERAIQWVVDEFRTGRIPLQGTREDWHPYYLDWANLSRIKTIDNVTKQVKGIKWVRNGRDHLALATILWRIGLDRFPETANFVAPRR